MNEEKNYKLIGEAYKTTTFFALLLTLSLVMIGYVLYAILLTGNPFKFSYGTILLVLVAVSLPSLIFMMYFSQKVQITLPSDEDSDYVVSCWSIETLRAAGVPRDVTKCLKDILEKHEISSPSKELSMKSSSADSPDGWLIKLKENLGETRVNEFSEVILKYTRRNTPKTNLTS